MMKILTHVLVFLITLIFISLSWSQSSPTEIAQLKAYGGYVHIPDYMRVVVQKRSEDSFEIRMFRKNDSDGDIEAIIINRPSRKFDVDLSVFDLIETYEVNGFSVELYKPSSSKRSSKLLSAQVIRCDEIGQIIFKHRPQLDQYLMEASSADCQE